MGRRSSRTFLWIEGSPVEVWALGGDRFAVRAPRHEQLVIGLEEAQQAADALAERARVGAGKAKETDASFCRRPPELSPRAVMTVPAPPPAPGPRGRRAKSAEPPAEYYPTPGQRRRRSTNVWEGTPPPGEPPWWWRRARTRFTRARARPRPLSASGNRDLPGPAPRRRRCSLRSGTCRVPSPARGPLAAPVCDDRPAIRQADRAGRRAIRHAEQADRPAQAAGRPQDPRAAAARDHRR